METFLRYIARRTRWKNEDIATEAVTHLINNCPEAGENLRQLLTSRGATMKGRIEVEPQVCGNDFGRPDLLVREICSDEIPAVIEHKIWAPLTKRQPLDYLKAMNVPHGLVLLVVPEIRAGLVWSEIVDICSRGRGADASPARSLKVDSHTIALVGWREYAQKLSAGLPPEWINQISQIEELVSMNYIQGFKPLQDADLDMGAARATLSLMQLAVAIAEAAAEEGYFTPWPRQTLEASSRWWSGTYGNLGPVKKAWIGFDAKLWLEERISPICLQFEDRSEVGQMRLLFADWVKKGRCIDLKEKLVVPISITPNVSQDIVVSDALHVIRELEARLLPRI